MNSPELLENANCLFCGSNHFKVLYTRVDARYFLDENIYAMNQCLDCEGYFLSPRVKEDYIARYYPDEFYLDQDLPGEVWKKEFTKNRKKYELYLRALKPGKLLDVGCRSGSFVKFMELFGWQAEGFEYSDAIKNRFGCRIYYKDLFQFSDDEYDVITLWAVLEHLYHPNDYLEYFYKILKPDGCLIIHVPKYNSFTGRVLLHEDVPRHVSAFTSNWIIDYVEKFGFELSELNTRCTVSNGSSRGFLCYPVLRILGRGRFEVLRAIYDSRGSRDGVINEIDRFLSTYLDMLLKRLNYWGQMTAVFKKKA